MKRKKSNEHENRKTRQKCNFQYRCKFGVKMNQDNGIVITLSYESRENNRDSYFEDFEVKNSDDKK